MNPKFGVCHIYPFYFKDLSKFNPHNNCFLGGGDRFVFEVGRAMAEKINTKLIILGKERRSFWYEKLLVEIYPAFNYFRKINGNSNPICISFIKELNYFDIIHLHGLRKDANIFAAIFSKLRDKKVLVTDYGWNGFCFGRIKILEHLIDGFLVLTEFEKKEFKKYLKPIFLIYGGVDTEKFTFYSKEKKVNRVLFVGRIMPHKGINYLIEAIDKNVELHIVGRVGDKKYFNFLKTLAKGKNVNFLLDIDDERLIREYHEAVVVVLPSVYRDVYGKFYPKPELFGLVLVEAMASGTPVIATDVGALPDVVEDGRTGFIVPPNNSSALREKINFFIQNPKKSIEMGLKGRELVLKKFTWEKVANRCINAYLKIVKRK